ncbi:MAG: hypothetical protein IPK17_37395 [Chloroflexi bacterium]|uniref:asparagine synthase-related protein n=1 Tax=Candidatus Flexifilum breve TaxID=3140694 RepID=UPI003136802A|nr:hypothetical protein [Chloroflexota bacterium]
MLTYLPDDLLIKTDRSGMPVSLKRARRFLDHRLVEMAATIPTTSSSKAARPSICSKKSGGGFTCPPGIHRPKHGFGVPLGAWLRTDIRRARSATGRAGARRGLLNTAAVTRLLDEHAAGKRDHGETLEPAYARDCGIACSLTPLNL